LEALDFVCVRNFWGSEKAIVMIWPKALDGGKMLPMVAPGLSLRWRAPLRSLLIGFGFFVLGSLSDSWLQRHAVSASRALMDDTILGIGAGLLVFLYEQGQRRNIAAREQAENAVKESEERFRLVANTAPVLIWMSGTDKQPTYFNQLWLDFTGRSEADLQAGLAGIVHPEDYQKCSEIYTQAFDQRQPFKKECRLRRRDGQYRWMLDIGVPRFHENGSFAGYIGSSVDVTEQKLAEEALSSVNRRLIEAQEQDAGGWHENCTTTSISAWRLSV
jgi:PAS domain S-box-containing protein